MSSGAPLSASGSAPRTERLYLSGEDAASPVSWGFDCTGGPRCARGLSIPVPGHWEFAGFGRLNYGHDNGMSMEVGTYRHRFSVPPDWRTKRLRLIFEGVMTDTEVRINGRSIGPPHRGGFERFGYELAGKIDLTGENLLEVVVAEHSANASVNRAERYADYWIFGGIYRPVYLEAWPLERVDHLWIDAQADGALTVRTDFVIADAGRSLTLEVLDAEGRVQGAPLGARLHPSQSSVTLRARIPEIEPWSSETPNLYTLRATLSAPDRRLHEATRTIGFRTVEVRTGQGLFINGRRVVLKGMSRHSFWPTSGRATTPAISESDVKLLREMNLNAVRTSHYPPDPHFLEACDRLGLYVIDELAGWHDAYDTELGLEMAYRLIARDAHHPSVIFWADGNEGGGDPIVAARMRELDPQNRPVLRPGEITDEFDNEHYPSYEELSEKLESRDGPLLLPTEALHGLYDGGMGSGLVDFWELMRRSPRGAGLFLWTFVDEAVVRADRDGSLDGAQDLAVDGVLGPFREREASFYTLRQVFAPVELVAPRPGELFGGSLRLRNGFDFSDLSGLTLEWRLLRLPAAGEPVESRGVFAEGSLALPAAEPGATVDLSIPLPVAHEADVVRLAVSHLDGDELVSWSFPASDGAELRRRSLANGNPAAEPACEEDAERVTLRSGNATLVFERSTGTIVAATNHRGEALSLSGGRLFGVETGEPSVRVEPTESQGCALHVEYPDTGSRLSWSSQRGGWIRLDYETPLGGSPPLVGLGVDYPEPLVEALTWVGPGPHRVWKNRVRGPQLDLWSKRGGGVTGTVWSYPELTGYHAAPRWATLSTAEGPISLVFDGAEVFLQVAPARFPEPGRGRRPDGLYPPYPGTTLSVLHTIPAMGSKFHRGEELGPSGRLETLEGRWSGSIDLYLGALPGNGLAAPSRID